MLDVTILTVKKVIITCLGHYDRHDIHKKTFKGVFEFVHQHATNRNIKYRPRTLNE